MALIKLKRGYDLNLAGKIARDISREAIATAPLGKTVAVVPDDFEGIIPRMEKKVGDHVVVGEPLYHDKNHESIKVTSPVSGTVTEVRRGERRKIEAIVIEPDGNQDRRTFDTKGSVKTLLLESGLWAMMRQRPYDIVPSPEVAPRDIAVTAFDSAPLAPSLLDILGDDKKYIARGIEALKTLTEGDVLVGAREGDSFDAGSAVVNHFKGPHPAGNAGVQLANVKPVNKGETVWTLDIVTVARLGKLLESGKLSTDTVVALVGSEVSEPKLIKAVMGQEISTLVKGELKESKAEPRIISGNVLTGVKVEAEGYLRAPYRQITVIPEVAHPDEFMGWASLSTKKFSVYRDFIGTIFGLDKKEHRLDAKINGGERAIVMSGEYDRMLPMDILAEFLIKAIISRDIDKMEQLGIYEVAPEDFALAEMACTSKLELQRIVREGLNYLRSEME
ncbi:MAG: Na(+)-translocating NADH-quinone reductase subunit A [Muribaculaceae bacterium]|nr:Na(+)-translocating NADH-quinone reductase subunit A [Muribaculaceae bacterium]